MFAHNLFDEMLRVGACIICNEMLLTATTTYAMNSSNEDSNLCNKSSNEGPNLCNEASYEG